MNSDIGIEFVVHSIWKRNLSYGPLLAGIQRH